MRSPRVLAALLACAAACKHGPPALDRAHLPAELRGMVPGVATERELADAFAGTTAVRDQTFGGTHRVELSGEPAMQVQSLSPAVEAWLIRIDRETRIASMFARLERSCGVVADELGDRVQRGPCNPRERAANEHAYCATTPDRQYTVDLACFDPRADGHPGWISVYVNFAPAHERWYFIGPPER